MKRNDLKDSQYFENLKNIFNTTVVTGKRIYLRRLKPLDINDLYVGFFQNAELAKYMYQTPRKIDAEHLLKELKSGEESHNFHMYGVFDKANDLIIGSIRVGWMVHAHKISDLAIFIGHPGYLGKGFATEAIGLGNQICFDVYDFRKLFGGMFEENIASIKAYMKTGWVVEGRLRGQYLVDGRQMDRINVACFNSKYFSPDFIKKVSSDSENYLKDCTWE